MLTANIDIQTTTANGTIRVAIVEDHHKLRQFLEFLFNNTNGYRCTGTFRTMEEALEKISFDPPDLALCAARELHRILDHSPDDCHRRARRVTRLLGQAVGLPKNAQISPMPVGDRMPGEPPLQRPAEPASGVLEEMGETIVGYGFTPMAQHGRCAGVGGGAFGSVHRLQIHLGSARRSPACR